MGMITEGVMNMPLPDDPIEAELLAMLQEPTAEKVRREQIKADILMQRVGRAIAPAMNKCFANLAADIESKQPK